MYKIKKKETLDSLTSITYKYREIGRISVRVLTTSILCDYENDIRSARYDLQQLRRLEVSVLSPIYPFVSVSQGESLDDVYSRYDIIRLPQPKHIAAISLSDFLWISSAEGQLMDNICMELGIAISLGIPIFSPTRIKNKIVSDYVQNVSSHTEAIRQVVAARRRPRKIDMDHLKDNSEIINKVSDDIREIFSKITRSGKGEKS